MVFLILCAITGFILVVCEALAADSLVECNPFGVWYRLSQTQME